MLLKRAGLGCVVHVLCAGVPHIRRELEMPAAALHHAGVHARQLELLEAALREVSKAAAAGPAAAAAAVGLCMRFVLLHGC
jgi:hypothetical protein